jgi:hypothetical protein
MIEEVLSSFSLSRAVLGVGLALFALFWAMKLRVARQITSLGGKSPEIPTYLPVGEYKYPYSSFR